MSPATSNNFPLPEKTTYGNKKSYNMKFLMVAIAAFTIVELCGAMLTSDAKDSLEFVPEVLLCIFLGALITFFKQFSSKTKPSPEAPLLNIKCQQHSQGKSLRTVPPRHTKAPPGLEHLAESKLPDSRNSSDTEAADDKTSAMARDLAKLNAPWRKATQAEERFVWKSQSAKGEPAPSKQQPSPREANARKQSPDVKGKKSPRAKSPRAQSEASPVPSSSPLLGTWIGFTPQRVRQQHTIVMSGKKLKCVTLTDAPQKDAPKVRSQYNLFVMEDGSTISWGTSGNITLDASKIADGKITWLNSKGPNWEWTLSNEGAQENV